MKKDDINNNIERIRHFVGDIFSEQLINVEFYIGKNIAVFIPCTGYCYYSISSNHTHPSFSFYYSYDRKIKMLMKGKVYHSRRGYISGLFPDIEHMEIPGENFNRFIAVLINKDFFLRHASLYREKLDPEMISYIKLPEQFIPCIKNLMIEVHERQDGNDEVIQAIEVQLTHILIRAAFSSCETSSRITERSDINYITEYINDHYSEAINLEDLSTMAAMSKSHFSRIFKKETGLTFKDYMIKVRIERAKLLLRRGQTKITEIAYKCGFSSSAHFTHTFVKHVGIKPSIYRNMKEIGETK